MLSPLGLIVSVDGVVAIAQESWNAGGFSASDASDWLATPYAPTWTMSASPSCSKVDTISLLNLAKVYYQYGYVSEASAVLLFIIQGGVDGPIPIPPVNGRDASVPAVQTHFYSRTEHQQSTRFTSFQPSSVEEPTGNCLEIWIE